MHSQLPAKIAGRTGNQNPTTTSITAALEILAAIHFLPYVLTAAISAIDIALHDIKGKALSVPVYQLLRGKHRDRVPTFASVKATTAEGMVAGARRVLEAGWQCVRLGRVDPTPEDPTLFEPWKSLTETARWMTECRAALGPDVILSIDWHHRLSVAETASFCQRMPDGTLDFIESRSAMRPPKPMKRYRR